MSELKELPELLTEEECNSIIEQTRPRLSPAYVGLSRNRVPSPARNALNCKYRTDTDWSLALRQKVAELTDESLEFIEPVEVVCYEVGGYYFRHNDGIDRLGTVTINLSSGYEGGALYFDQLDKLYDKLPVGTGLYYPIDSGSTRHEVRPVTGGEKWTAIVWINKYTPEGRILSGRDPEVELSPDSPIILP